VQEVSYTKGHDLIRYHVAECRMIPSESFRSSDVGVSGHFLHRLEERGLMKKIKRSPHSHIWQATTEFWNVVAKFDIQKQGD
jgi:hypothetical protein